MEKYDFNCISSFEQGQFHWFQNNVCVRPFIPLLKYIVTKLRVVGFFLIFFFYKTIKTLNDLQCSWFCKILGE